jgi:hypothetical protein
MRVPFPAVWSLGAMLALHSPVQAQDTAAQLPVSIERIRAGLNRPPSPLQVPSTSVDRPTFRVEVQERLFVLDPIPDKPFDPTFGLPSVGELLMSGVENIRSAAVGYKRRRAERRVRKEVDGALAAFCAVRQCSTPDADK